MEFYRATMSTAAMTCRLEWPSLADIALKAAERFCFVVTVISQLVFASSLFTALLAEAYMDDGNKPQVIANYQKFLELNPKNGNAVLRLQKLK